jgi:anti-sigma factor RsiW
MTDCPNGDVRDLLPDLIHGRLTTAEREVVESHVRGCAECREELTLLRAMTATLRRAPRVDVATVAAAIPVYRAPVRRSWGGWRAAAAIVALAAGGTSVAVMQRDAGLRTDSLGAPLVVAQAPNTAVVARAAAPTRELALGSAAVGDLDDSELLVLLQDLQSLEVLPSADVETSTIVPASAAGTE